MSALRAAHIGEDISIEKLLELLGFWTLSIRQYSKEDNGLETGSAYILSEGLGNTSILGSITKSWPQLLDPVLVASSRKYARCSYIYISLLWYIIEMTACTCLLGLFSSTSLILRMQGFLSYANAMYNSVTFCTSVQMHWCRNLRLFLCNGPNRVRASQLFFWEWKNDQVSETCSLESRVLYTRMGTA
jgi:hypothetical protein